MFFIWLFLIGSCLGSFVNVVVIRKSLVSLDRSKCPNCKHSLTFIYMIPIFGYLLLKGRCKYCHNKINIRYLLVEIIGGLITLLSYIYTSSWLIFILYVILQFSMLSIALVDYESMEVPISYELFLFVLAGIIFWVKKDYINGIMGSLIISVPMLVIVLITKGFGIADVLFVGTMGLVLGSQKVLIGTIIAMILESSIAIFSIIIKKSKLDSKLPFLPALAIGMAISLFWGSKILWWYYVLI